MRVATLALGALVWAAVATFVPVQAMESKFAKNIDEKKLTQVRGWLGGAAAASRCHVAVVPWMSCPLLSVPLVFLPVAPRV